MVSLENSMQYSKHVTALTRNYILRFTSQRNKNLCSQKTCTQTSVKALLVIAPNWKLFKCPSVGERLNKLEHIHVMEFYAQIKRNKLLIHRTIWMNLQRIILNEKGQSQKIIYYIR